MKRIASVFAGAALAVSVSPPATAGAMHEVVLEDWKGSETFAAGEGPCVTWAGTFSEERTGSYRIVAAPGGQVAGEFHINGVINGHVELVPDDPDNPTYSGNYREKLNGVVTGFDEETGDQLRIGQYRLRVPLNGSDGSRFVFTLSGKVTVNATGAIVVARDSEACR